MGASCSACSGSPASAVQASGAGWQRSELRGRGRLVALVVLGILAQIGRNWLVLHAVGVDTSVFNAIAVLIVSVSLSPLPFGAGVGATATVLILGSHGLADTAAAGVLLAVDRDGGRALLRRLGLRRPRDRRGPHPPRRRPDLTAPDGQPS